MAGKNLALTVACTLPRDDFQHQKRCADRGRITFIGWAQVAGRMAIEQYQLHPKRLAPRGETADYQTSSETPATGPDHPQTHIATTIKVTDNTAEKLWLHTHAKCA